jgi:gamma-glutamyltranspeptidase/glutathione hydrolase|tara:strand:- start:1640 stop:3334 length:1695 start_codon:yes stop_codon:yes gene_type:complete
MKNKLFFILCFLLITCSKRSPVHGQNGMVVSTSQQASQVGIDILDKGGNAVDAAVAVGFTLAVTSSSNGNIGGGGFMVARLNDETTFTLDYREMAPQAAFKDMYLDSVGNVIKGKSTRTHFASGVPGSVDGLLKAWSDYGSGNISINQLIGPAIKYAEQGFKLSKYEAKRFNNRKSFLSKHPETKRIFTRMDRKWKAGDIFYQKDLAETLKRIVEKGRDGFYLGKTAELIVSEMDNVGGWITLEDLKNYSSKYREPIYGQFNDFKIISMGPPSSGGILLVLMLNMIDEIFKSNANDLDNLKFNSRDYVHLITEVERRAYADRATHLGDDDFWDVPTSMLLSKKYAQKRVKDIDLSQASLSKVIKAGNSKGNESEETTHYSVVDKDGSAVSVTTTINSGYGSGITVTGAGFILNNEMDDFSSKPGVPNMFGLLGNEANAIQPSKRPLSSMTPSIILKDNKPFLILGTPGGSTIITTVLQNFLNVTLHDMTIKEAVDAPRFHSQWMPDLIEYEKNSLSKKIIKQLEEMGHNLKLRGNIGEANGIMIDENGFWGGADKRGENTAVGY